LFAANPALISVETCNAKISEPWTIDAKSIGTNSFSLRPHRVATERR
jgi:hypothetical protein